MVMFSCFSRKIVSINAAFAVLNPQLLKRQPLEERPTKATNKKDSRN
jgi:hypothetical protein